MIVDDVSHAEAAEDDAEDICLMGSGDMENER
jgi:hypothetical protein